MKKIILCIFLLYSGMLFASEPLKIGVITDTHFLSEKLMDNGYAVQNYIYNSGKNIQDVPAVLDKVLYEYQESDIDILFICGDLTKDGEKQSHLDFAAKLKPLYEKGIKIYVIPGNHDINMPNAVKFIGNKTFPTENITPEEFTSIYADYGYKDAIRQDSTSLSYVAKLNDNTWLLAIDAARYKEYSTRSISAGRISPETEKWITEILDNAKDLNINVIGMMHWGLTEHIMHQSMFFKDYLIDDWQRLSVLFADKGMKAAFTGHFHSNDISAFTSDNGNTIYDIETGTLASYPFSYRYVNLYNDKMEIETKNITSIPENPLLAKNDMKRMQILAQRQAERKLKSMKLDMSEETTKLFADVLSQIYIKHAFGDETIDDNLKTSLEQLAQSMDSPFDISDVMLDYPPADNNITIVF